MTSEAAAASHRSRRKLDVRTRSKVLRLARRSRRHPDPEVSLKAYEWARDRLLFPLWRDLLWTVVGGLLELGVALAALVALNRSMRPVIALARVFGVLPDETWVYPGNGGDTTLGTERPHLAEWRTRGW